MFIRPARYALFAATGLGAAAAILVGLFGLQSGRADAQGIMSAPACQCSAPTAIPSMSTSVVHCMCGGMSCVVSEHTGAGKNTNLMQCVK